jgi:hypothetical protein
VVELTINISCYQTEIQRRKKSKTSGKQNLQTANKDCSLSNLQH